MGRKVSVKDRLAWILAGLEPLADEEVPLCEAHGRTLAADVRARHDLPLWDNSAMDGFAVRAADAPGEFTVVGEVLAGSDANPRFDERQAVRIMTGAPVPSDADAVAPIEHAEAAEGWASTTVRIPEPVSCGANIRRRGEDTRADAVIAHRGDLVTASRLSALAAAGTARVRVSRVPRVAVLVTGAELREPGASLRRGEIPESNSLLIAGLLREAGVEAITVRRDVDDVSAVRGLLRELAADCDVIITTGGVGPGSRDVMRIALESEPDVSQVHVAVKPGQPQCAGRLADGAFIVALPGNPVSAGVCFELFVRPALLHLQSRSSIHRRTVTAVADTAWKGSPGRLQLMPIVFDGMRVKPSVNPRGVSHAVGSHGNTQGYALIPPEHGDVNIGDEIEVMMVHE